MTTSKTPTEEFWIKFDIGDWLNDPALRKMRRENRDSWLTACLMMRLERNFFLAGTTQELANLLHLTTLEFEDFYDDLKRTKTADVTRRGGNVRLMSRRYKKEFEAREHERLRKRLQRVPQMSHKCPTPIVRVRDKDRDKKKSGGGEISNPQTALAQEPEPPTVPPPDKPQDLRRSHPVIVAIREVLNSFPPKDVWDELIDHVPIDIDMEKLKTCYRKWRAQGFKPMNFGWALDWYVNGIPDLSRGKNGSSTRPSNQRNPERATSEDRLRDTADILSEYPSEVDTIG